MALIIDIETTGLPNRTGLKFDVNPLYSNNTKYDSCRIVQISYILCDNKLEKIELSDDIIKVNFNIPNSNIHGINNEISINLGIEFNLFCDKFKKIINKCSHIISHNVDFDINVIKNELYRINKNDIIDEINKKKLICTMKEMKNIMKIKNITNRYYKNPSLKELYKYATKKDITNEHNSKHDVINLHEALILLYQNNIFIINDIINYDKIENNKNIENIESIENIENNKNIESIESIENNEIILELKKLKLIQLKSKCKEYGLSCYSRLNKEQLIKLLNSSNKLL